VGNHEFDFGEKNLFRLARRAKFPLLAANLTRPGHSMEPIRAHLLLAPPRTPCRVLIVGLITPTTPAITSPAIGRAMRFADPAKTMRRQLRAIPADLVIALTHLGLAADLALARAVPAIDLIVGGHSHTPAVTRERGVTIIQTHSHGLSLARADLRFDPDTLELLAVKGELLAVDPAITPRDPAVAAVIDRYAKGLDERMARIVGRLTAPLRRVRGRASSPAGNWMADVIRSAGKARIGFTNKGGIRCDLGAGPVTTGDLYRLMPFDNVLVGMDLPGSVLRELVEQHLRVGQHPGLEWSGMRVEAIRDGDRLVPVRIEVSGRLLEDDGVYRIATNSFLAAGGDGFWGFRQGRNRSRSARLLRDILAEAFERDSPVTPPAGARLVLPAGVH